MIIKIEWIQLLFFTFSFATFFSYSFTNKIFTSRLQNSSIDLPLLVTNILFFITGKSYGNLINRIPLRLISYIFFCQAILSIFLIPQFILLNCPITFIKSFFSGIAYSTIFSLMSRKTKGWNFSKYPVQIGIFIGTIIVSNILVYILSKLKTYITIISDIGIGYLLYKLSSNDIKMDEIVEDKDKLTDIKFIFNSIINSLNSIVIFIVQRERAFILSQVLLIIKIIAYIAFFCLISKDILFINMDTYYYISINVLKKINMYVKNETIHHHIEHIYQRLENRMINSLLLKMKIKKNLLEANAKEFQ